MDVKVVFIMYMLDFELFLCDVMDFKVGDIILVEMLEYIMVLIEELFLFRVKLGCFREYLVLKIIEKIVWLIFVKLELQLFICGGCIIDNDVELQVLEEDL